MRCIVTAGPTYESMDMVRRLTNFSTGRLGCELASFLSSRGHDVTLFVGEQATYPGERRASQVEVFTTTADLQHRLQQLGAPAVGAVFHAAAVSDFTFGKVWVRSPQGDLREIQSGKISTREGTLLAELVPTPKLIPQLRDWFSKAIIVGWKYEVEGGRDQAIDLARKQIQQCRTTACVANGAAYGPGFGLVHDRGDCVHLPDRDRLFEALDGLIAEGV